MKTDVRKESMSVAPVVAAILALLVPVAARAQEIPPGPVTVLPDYIGQPAKAHPAANSGVPQNLLLAPNPFNSAHADPWMSDTADVAGPLGRDPEVLSSTLAGARNYPDDSTIFHCVGTAFDSHGHLITPCTGTGPSGQEASVVLADARSLEVLAHYHLPTPTDSLSALSACYWYFDSRDRFTISAGPNRIITLVEGGSEANLELTPQDDGYDLSGVVPDDDRIAGVMTDWQGRIWFVTAGGGEDTAKACVLNPATYPDVKCQSLGDRDPTNGKHEKIFNTFAVTRTGAYIVTSEKMYRVWAGSDDAPYVVWSEPYATIDEIRPGQYELGSGTSPTILGEGKYVAITDNADQLQVVVFRTDELLGPKETRKVCEVPVFDFEGGGAGALSNSLIGSRLSLIVENTYGYDMYWQRDGKPPSAPGFERIDINPDGKGCTKVWSNHVVASTISGKLSTRTGLIYVYARKMDNNLDVYYLTALDFRTGEVVWERRVGAGFAFDHYYTGLVVGTAETIYAGLYGGLISIRDAY
jgi:outer membrane protein assembly factor BamB